MPVLSNPKYERFAQELAKGNTATESYVLAGYKANDGNAATLKGNKRIQARVSELLERAASRVEVSVSSIAERLLRLSDKGEALGEAAGFSVARQAAMDVAKLHGLIVEKKETGKPGDFSKMDDHELDAFIAREKTALGIGSGGETKPGRKAGVSKSRDLH